MYLRTLMVDELFEYARSQVDNELAQEIMARIDADEPLLRQEVADLQSALDKAHEDNRGLSDRIADLEWDLKKAHERIEEMESGIDLV